MSPERTSPFPSAHERGSAYIVALMALLVLTIGGLAVTLVSQTEMQVGMNEKVIQRTFYAAESGLSLASSYMLTVGGACQPRLQSGLGRPGWAYVAELETDPHVGTFADVATVSPALVLFKGCCNWCPCQEGQNDEIHRFNYGLIADSERQTADPTGPLASGYAVIASKTVGAVLDIQPFHASEVAQCMSVDPDIVRRFKF